VHVDVGPVRAWTQGTANVRKGQSDENKRIILHPGYDIYRPGERLGARFARMTAYPIGVARAFTLQRHNNGAWTDVGKGALAHRAKAKKGCRRLSSIAEMMGFAWKIPQKIPAGRYRLQVAFCAVKWPAMPKRLASLPIEIRP